MTAIEIKVQLCEVMLTMEHLQRQFEQYGQYKQQLQQQLQEAVKAEQAQKVAEQPKKEAAHEPVTIIEEDPV